MLRRRNQSLIDHDQLLGIERCGKKKLLLTARRSETAQPKDQTAAQQPCTKCFFHGDAVHGGPRVNVHLG
jgi:hypothetical protein